MESLDRFLGNGISVRAFAVDLALKTIIYTCIYRPDVTSERGWVGVKNHQLLIPSVLEGVDKSEAFARSLC